MEHTRTVTREFETGDHAVLQLESRSGAVIVEGRESDRVVVDAVVRVWTDLSAEADDAAALVAQSMQQDGNRVTVRAPSLPRRDGWAALFGQGSRVEYTVRVPRRTEVRLLSKSGSVHVLRTEGALRVEALSGRLTVEEVRGDVTLVSRSGALTVQRVTGAVEIESRSGKVTVQEISGPVAIEARSGAIETKDVAGDVRVSARAGSLSVENAGARVYARTRAGSMRYRGRVLGDFDLEAVAGSITLAVDPDYPFFVDAESHGGSVRSDLPPRRNGAEPAEGGPKVRVRTRAGSIRLTRA